jgi:putative Ca2+/H+ antiporter (TMEM165/GDT1 family)
MESFFVSMFVVAVGEIGDKTQLLAFMLATRFRRPVPILFGILAATIVNHALAGALGTAIRSALDPQILRALLAFSFFAIALWALKPDTIESGPRGSGKYGIFAFTVVVFFLAEIGDKTQLATMALAAKYDSLPAVVAGTTAGMLLADAPAVLFAERIALKIPLRLIRYVSAALFALLGAAVAFGLGF